MVVNAERPIHEIPPKKEVLVPREAMSTLLESMGAEVMAVGIDAYSPKRGERHYYIKGNPGIYERFGINRPIEDQDLPPNPKIRGMELAAGAVPFIKTIPVEVQRFMEDALEQHVLPTGHKAGMQGVIMQEEYSPLKIPDSLGIGKKSLRYPRIQIDIYDPDNEYVEDIVLNFVDREREKQIRRINALIQELSPEEREIAEKRAQEFYDQLDRDGIADRPVINRASIGSMAQRKGLTVLDAQEIVLKYESEKEWLEDTNIWSGKLDLTKKQRLILARRKELYSREELDPGETLMPTPIDVIEEAQRMAEESGAPAEVLEGLASWHSDALEGKTHVFHNCIRFEIWERGNQIAANFRTMDAILKSQRLIPREGTFTKGEYLASVQIGKESLGDMNPLMIEGHYETAEQVPIVGIFEIAKKPMPEFKHQHCSVSYVDVPLRGNLRRLIVKEEHLKKTRELLEQRGFEDVALIPYKTWSLEVALMSEAQENLENLSD